MKQIFSNLFSVNNRDVIKSIVMAFLGAFIAGLVKYLKMGTFPDGGQWKTIVISGLSTGLAYLLKNFITNNNDQILKKD